MKIVKLEPRNNKETRENIIKEMNECDSFLVIYNHKEAIRYQYVNMNDPIAVFACEAVKQYLMKDALDV